MNRLAGILLVLGLASLPALACDHGGGESEATQDDELTVDVVEFEGPLVPPVSPPQDGGAVVTVFQGPSLDPEEDPP